MIHCMVDGEVKIIPHCCFLNFYGPSGPYLQLLCEQDLAEHTQAHVDGCRVRWFRGYLLPKSQENTYQCRRHFKLFLRNGREWIALWSPVRARVVLDLTRARITSALATVDAASSGAFSFTSTGVAIAWPHAAKNGLRTVRDSFFRKNKKGGTSIGHLMERDIGHQNG